MVGLLDIARTPQGLGLLLSGAGSVLSGDPSHVRNVVTIQGAFADLDAQRQALEERGRRRAAMSRLPGLFAEIEADPDGGAGRYGEMVGLLAEADPEKFVGLLSERVLRPAEEPRASTDIQTMRDLGIPLTEENYARFKAMGGNARGGSLEQVLQMLQIQKTQQDLATAGDERARAADDRTTKRRATERTMTRSLSDIEHALDLVDQTEGTFLETGIPFGDARRSILSGSRAAMAAFGMDRPDMGDTLDAYDQLNKTLNRLVISRDTGSMGTLTDSKLKLVQDAMGSTKIAPTALRSVLLDAAESMLDEADINGYDIGDPGAYAERIAARRKQKRKAPTTAVDLPGAAADLRDGGAAAVAAGAEMAADAADAGRALAIRAADIARMGADQLMALDVDALPDDLSDAVLERLDKLTGK